MTPQKKVILAISSTIIMVCVCCGGFGIWGTWTISSTIVTDPTQVKELGRNIATYTLPPGYQEIMGMRFLGNDILVIGNPNDPSNKMLIMFMKVPNPNDIDRAAMERQLETAVQQQFSFQSLNLTLDYVETHTINGEEVPLTFRKGQDNNGTPYRQMSALFNSQQGSAFILVQGVEAGWDQQALDSLLDSIK